MEPEEELLRKQKRLGPTVAAVIPSRASRLRASSEAAYSVRGLTIDSIAQRSLVVLRADSRTCLFLFFRLYP